MCIRDRYRAGRWGGMCLRPVHFLLPAVPVVPGGSAAAGQRTGNGPVPPPGRQALRRLRGAVHPRLQPGQILPGMCAESPPAAEGRVRAPEKGTAVSYTHLDVYKRQANFYRPRNFERRPYTAVR